MEIRPLKESEYAESKHFILTLAPERESIPLQSFVAKFDKGKIVGLLGIQRVLLLEPLIADSALHMRDLMIWVDGAMNLIAGYFFIGSTEKLQRIYERHFPEVVHKIPGNLYARVNKCQG